MTTTGAPPEPHSQADETQHFRSHMGRVSRQSLVFFAGTIFSAAAAYFFKVYLARVLGAEALGVYALGMTIVGFVTVFSSLGLPRAALRYVSAYSATGKTALLRGFLAQSLVALGLCNALLAGAMYFAGPRIAVRFYHAPQLAPYIGWFVLIMLIGVLTAFLGQVLGGYKNVTRRTVINNFIGSPVMMTATVVLVVLGFGLRGYIVAQLLSAALVLVVYGTLVWKLTPKVDSTSRVLPLEREVISFSAAALGLAFLDFFISQADRVLIGRYLDVRDVGIYAVAWSMVAYLPIVLSSVNQIFAPTISDLHARGQRELLGRMFQTLTKWTLGLTVPLAAVMIIFAAPLMRIFGPDFELGAPILVIGAVGQLVNCGVGSSGIMLLMSGNQRSLIWVQGASAVIMVALNLLLIPYWGIVGAALASAITVVVTNVANLGRVRRTLHLSPYNRSYARLAFPFLASIAVVLMARVAVAWIRPGWMMIGIGLVLAYVVFIGTALFVGLDADDRIIARAVWARISSVLPGAEVGS